MACNGSSASHGDVIDFVSKYENIEPGEAAQRIVGERMPIALRAPQREMPPDVTELWKPIIPVPEDAPPYDPAKTFNPRRNGGEISTWRPVRVDPYRDSSGRLICHVARLEWLDDAGEKIKLCPVVTYCEGPDGVRQWCSRRMAPPYPLQGLDELAARPKATVMVVEGEKKRALAAEAWPDVVWVSVMGGSAAIDLADVRPLKKRDVVYWPDADDPGRKAMAKLAERVRDA
jgi:putative DNA primase/helicase